SGSNIIITSFTCDGVYRWSRVIGGGVQSIPNQSFKLVLDNNGGIYISAKITHSHQVGANPPPPVCFSESDCKPYTNGEGQPEQEGYRMGYLLKYDTDNGELLWRKDYQGNVALANGFMLVFDLQIDSSNILHTVIGLKNGVHLDGALTVELDEGEQYKYYLVKFDAITGNVTGTPLQLPMEGFIYERNLTFRYDEALNRYY